jgi:hypothetical protein
MPGGAKGEIVWVHRLSAHYYLKFDLKSKLCVLHKCDNPACFNPKHLFIGTHADNNADKIAKGRWDGPKPWTHCRRGHPLKLIVGAKPSYGHKSRRCCPTCDKARRLTRESRLRVVDAGN